MRGETSRSYPGRPAWAAHVPPSLPPVGLARKLGTKRRNSPRAVQKSAEVVVPILECQSRREGPNDEEQGRAFDRLGARDMDLSKFFDRIQHDIDTLCPRRFRLIDMLCPRRFVFPGFRWCSLNTVNPRVDLRRISCGALPRVDHLSIIKQSNPPEARHPRGALKTILLGEQRSKLQSTINRRVAGSSPIRGAIAHPQPMWFRPFVRLDAPSKD